MVSIQQTMEYMFEPLQDFELETIDFKSLRASYPPLNSFGSKIGGTRLMEVPSFNDVNIYAKIESENPFGSIKDRTAFALICSFLSGRNLCCRSDWRIVEASGGNLAIPIAFLASQLNIEVSLCVSESCPQSIVDRIKEYGAELRFVSKDRGFLGVMNEAHSIQEDNPNTHWLCQHRNYTNVQYHYQTTGREIIEQLSTQFEKKPDAFVTSIGTGGTFAGVSKAIIESNHCATLIAVTPDELPMGSKLPPNGLPKYSGSGGLGWGIVQPLVRNTMPFEAATVSFPESLVGMRRFRELTQTRIGSSSAANWLTAVELAKKMEPGSSIVTIFPDAGAPEEWILANDS